MIEGDLVVGALAFAREVAAPPAAPAGEPADATGLAVPPGLFDAAALGSQAGAGRAGAAARRRRRARGRSSFASTRDSNASASSGRGRRVARVGGDAVRLPGGAGAAKVPGLPDRAPARRRNRKRGGHRYRHDGDRHRERVRECGDSTSCSSAGVKIAAQSAKSQRRPPLCRRGRERQAVRGGTAGATRPDPSHDRLECAWRASTSRSKPSWKTSGLKRKILARLDAACPPKRSWPRTRRASASTRSRTRRARAAHGRRHSFLQPGACDQARRDRSRRSNRPLSAIGDGHRPGQAARKVRRRRARRRRAGQHADVQPVSARGESPPPRGRPAARGRCSDGPFRDGARSFRDR